MKQIRPWVIALAVLFLALFPYWIAARAATPDTVFGGFLLNPIDGNSYLAKMYQGWTGTWQFTLPFSAQPGEGSYLFLYYLLLGHISRVLGLSLLITFQLARVIGILAILFTLFRYFQSILPESRLAGSAFMLAALGGGLGWLAYPFGGLFTPDFWVAEAYPFLSAYANPHFPLAIAVLLWLLMSALRKPRAAGLATLFVGGFFLALLLPFGVVLAGAVLFIQAVWDWRETGGFNWQGWAAPCLGGAPVLIYQVWVTRTNPALAVWNSQNQTPSPSILLLILGLSPVLLLAVFGAVHAFRGREPGSRQLIVWAIVSLVLLFIPFSLQRRFMLGIFIPLAGLAVLSINELSSGVIKRYRLFEIVLLMLSFPTILVVILSGFHGIQTLDSALYLTRGEIQAFDWIRRNTQPGDLILASPGTGLLIPAYTGRRVVYGHPFETIDAERQRETAERFYQEGTAEEERGQLVASERIKYIFFGPREHLLSAEAPAWKYPIAYTAEGVTLYASQGPED